MNYLAKMHEVKPDYLERILIYKLNKEIIRYSIIAIV
jgi:hypothetical protein